MDLFILLTYQNNTAKIQKIILLCSPKVRHPWRRSDWSFCLHTFFFFSFLTKHIQVHICCNCENLYKRWKHHCGRFASKQETAANTKTHTLLKIRNHGLLLLICLELHNMDLWGFALMSRYSVSYCYCCFYLYDWSKWHLGTNSCYQHDNLIVMFSQSSIWAAVLLTFQQEHPAYQTPAGGGGTLHRRH